MFGAVMTITSSFTVADVTAQLCGSPSTDYAAHTILNHLNDYGGVRFDMGYGVCHCNDFVYHHACVKPYYSKIAS